MKRKQRTANPRSLLHGSDNNQEVEEILKHQEGDDHDYKDNETSKGADRQKGYDGHVKIVMRQHRSNDRTPTLTIKEEMQKMLIQLVFSQTVAEELVENQGIDSSSICNLM